MRKLLKAATRYMRRDIRSTAEALEDRDYNNRKSFRTKAWKDKAAKGHYVTADGHFEYPYGLSFHARRNDLLPKNKRRSARVKI